MIIIIVKVTRLINKQDLIQDKINFWIISKIIINRNLIIDNNFNHYIYILLLFAINYIYLSKSK